VLPLLAALASAVFALLVARQFLARHRAHQLAWALGLAAFAGASAIDAAVAASGWNAPLYWTYLALASGNVGLLGAGTIYLLRRRVAAHVFAALVALGILVVALAPAFVAPTSDLATGGPELGLGAVPKEGMGEAARVSFILLSSVGGTALIGGALWSWWRTRDGDVLLIALGALVVAAGGTVEGLASRYLSETSVAALDFRLLTQFVGIAVMFAGFLRSRDPSTGDGGARAPMARA
jgi:hypothetical protein